MTPLERLIHQDIALNGPMTLGRYMGLCLGHPQHGYYMTRDPFGEAGDFITAPEVSQMFGEVIGAWLADTWKRLGSPPKFLLVEAGPGRGTFMDDILRATQNVPGFHAAAHIHLLEMSPVLKETQRATLKDHAVHWHESLDTLPDDAPILFVANEFLDALPFEQMQFDQGEWLQRAVGSEADNSLLIGLKGAEPALSGYPDALSIEPEQGDVLEVSPAVDAFVRQLAIRVKNQSGAGLFIDYGYAATTYGVTMQALHKHQPVSIFHLPGESDITAHVNFEGVAAHLEAMDLHATPIKEQGAFLKTLGIEIRLKRLLTQASADQAKDLQGGYEMLTDPEQMGSLFKVLGFCHDAAIPLAGFES